jgi:hypothetical protein
VMSRTRYRPNSGRPMAPETYKMTLKGLPAAQNLSPLPER